MRDDPEPDAPPERAAPVAPILTRLGEAARRGRGLLLPLFCLQFVLLDLALRRGRAIHHYASSPSAALVALHSACLWLALVIACGRARWLRAGLGLVAGFVVAFQAMCFARFSRFVDRHVARTALLSWDDVAPAFHAELPRLAAITVIVAAVEIAWLRGCRAPSFGRRRAGALAAFALLLLVPLTVTNRGAPDLRLVDVAAALPFASPERVAVAATSVPNVRSPRASLPNVVLLMTESVRADEYCSAPRPACPTAPEINALLPDRVGIPQMRSVASFTVVSMSALLTGRAQNIPRVELLASPTVFDALKALEAGGDEPYTAYWSAHHAPMFSWDDPRRSIDSYVTHETLFEQEGASHNADVRLSEMFRARLQGLPSPFFVVLHFHDTHILYGFDESRAPFAPWTRDVRWETMPELRNAYRNAIHAQDRSIAAAMRALREDPRWPSTFVLFTSDHGEAFGEHQAIHHGQNLLDEQVHVPAWIAHGEDVLSPEEKAALRVNAGTFVTHLDVAPTLLDLYGLWDAPELRPYTKKMPGRSLLRPHSEPLRAVPMTNCSETFPCPFNNWGMLRGDHKLEAQAWDREWRCRVIDGDREVDAPPGDPECEALLNESRAELPDLPNGSPND